MNFNRIHQKPKVLLAPNGQPSNLTPEQYRLVRTPAFKAWFGDWEIAYKTKNYNSVSKILDENYEPMVVYHLTDEKFNLIVNKKDSSYNNYIFLTQATDFDGVGEKKYKMKFFLNLKDKIFLIKGDGNYENKWGKDIGLNLLKGIDKNTKKKLKETISKNKHRLKKFWIQTGVDSPKEIANEVSDKIDVSKDEDLIWEFMYNWFDGYMLLESDIIVDFMQKNGYYSYISNEEGSFNFVIHSSLSNCLKLADGTNTTFDGSNPDIRFDDGGLIEKEIKISDILEENRDGQKLSDAIINVKDGLGSQTGGNILVREVNGKYEVGDGFHRLAKAVIDGRKTIKADIISNHIRYADGGLIEQSTTLYFREGNSDKEYHIQLVDLGRGDYVVNFQYGRRGGSLKSGTKTENPVSLYQAEDIFASLKSEKMRKGYEPNNQQQHRPTETKKVDVIVEEISVKKALEYLNYLFLITEPEAKQIRILPQLLNAIENEQPYIDDDSFLAQEKKDGERRMIISDSFGIKGLNKKGQEVPVLDEIKDSIDSICVLDGEIIGTRLYVFDILSLNNRELKSLACVERIQILESINFGNSVIVVQTAYTRTDKQKLFDKLKDERREGIVFKKKLAPYTVGRPSSGGNQFKFKFYKTATFIVANSTPNKRSVGLELIDNNTQRVFMGKVTIPPNYEVPEIGDLVEVRYLYAYRGGAVYQPVYLGKRNDSDLTDATMRQIVFKADEYADGGITKKKETDKKDLVALHNISPYQIIEADKLGGMVTPSIAILKAGERYTDFGEITLIADKDLINPENSSVRVFSGDVYSPSVPNKLYVISPELEKKGRELSVKAYSSKYRDFGGAISNLIQDYGSVYKDMRRLPKDELIAKYYEDLRLVYLIDKGIDFEIPYEDKEQYLWGNQQFTLTKEQKERAKELLKKHSEETVGSSRDISKETIKGFYDLYWEVVFDINFEEFKDEEVDIRELSEKMTKDRYKALFEKYIGDESWISNFYIDKLSDIVSAKQVINKSELANSIKSEFTPEVEADYKKWVNDFMNRYQGSEYFEKGNKKIPYNLENLVEATTGSVRGVEKNLTYSQNKAKSFSSKEFKSIEDIKKSKDKLVSKEQMNLIDEENKEAFMELYDRLNYEWESSWKGLDSLAMAVADFYKGKSASQALQKNDFKNPTNHQITIFEDFAKKLKNSPVDYFEAKIQRAVLLSEFNYAVVPSEGYPKVIDEVVKILEKNDLQVYYYNPNVVKDRMKVVNSIVRKDKSLKFDMGGQAPDVIINPTQIECHNCHWEWKVKDGGDLIEELGYKVKKYADGGLAIDQYTSEKIKKAFVSIRIRYESGRAEDDTKDFYFNKYELKSFDQKPFEELKDHKLKGILGVSTSNYNLSEWLVHRECLVVMPFDKFKEMNDTEQVQYYDADYLSKNGFDSLHRLYDRKGRTDEDYRSVLQNVFPKIAMEFNLEAMVTQYSNLYAVEYWFNVYNSSRFIDYVSKQKRIDSPEELAQIVVDYSKSEQSVTDYYYQKPAKELTVESIIKPITNGIVSSGRIYVDESEWLIKNKELVIPENSQLFFVIKDYENMRDKYEEIISQYDLRSSYKIGFINQKNLNDLQSSRFRLKDLKWKGEYEKARTNTEKNILKALKNIQSNIIEDWTNKIIDDFKETYSDSVYSDYDGNEYSTNILEVPSAIIYFDSLMLKFIEIYDSYIDNILKTKHRYSFSYIFNDFYTYLDDLLKYSNEEADDLEVSTPYNRIYKSDMIQKLRYFVKNTDNYSKLGEQIKTEVGSDLYRYFTKDEIGFKDGGTTMQKFPIRRYTADEVKKKSEKVSSMINNVLKEIRWHDGKRVKYPLGEEVAILQSALPDLRAERERVYAVYVDMKRKRQNSISSTQVLTLSIPNVRDINLATRLLNAKYVINYTILNNAMTVDGKFYSGYELNSLENQIGEYSNLLFPESSQNSDREALEYLKSELESEPDNQEIKDAIEYLESEMGEKYADGGEIGNFVGYHCSDNPNLEEERSSLMLGEDDYYEWHRQVLENIRDKYPKAQEYQDRIEDNEPIGFDEELTEEINAFLKKLNIRGIFVSETEPNDRWGKYCYKVYFDKIEFGGIQDFLLLQEEGDEYSFLYPYQKVKPKFIKLSNGEYSDGGEVKYLEIIKGEKSILKARVQKGDASLTGSMIDSLVDKGYKIKEVSKEDYDKFDYSNVDTEDLNDFVSSMDMFN